MEIRTFKGSKGTYLVFKTKGAYHTFVETEAKFAAMDCGSGLARSANTRVHWDKLWNQKP